MLISEFNGVHSYGARLIVTLVFTILCKISAELFIAAA